MPRNPDDYSSILGKKMREHNTNVFLVNTGWSGGAYGTGRRMDINLTRKIVDAALSGALEGVEYIEDKRFHLCVPTTCPGIEDESVLMPQNTWNDKALFEERANRLAEEFSRHFDKAYGDKNIDPAVRAECPGK
jgi:phosphoenolpyruvate carboxykinase (ATP)